MNDENLVPLTTNKAREIGRLGGIKSGKTKRKRKLMSQIYADFLAKSHEIEIDDQIKCVSSDELISIVMNKILSKSDSASVSMMKEIRETIEGKALQKVEQKNIEMPVTKSDIEDRLKKIAESQGLTIEQLKQKEGII